jgi:hypothetical protein
MRPQVVLFVGLALVLVWASTAEAGRNGRKSRKSRGRPSAQTQPRSVPAPPPAPAPAVSDDEGKASRARLARGEGTAADKAAKPREKVFDFSGLELSGSERMPQLLYFLDRAEEELERASLERRSFVPEMMRSLDEESL